MSLDYSIYEASDTAQLDAVEENLKETAFADGFDGTIDLEDVLTRARELGRKAAQGQKYAEVAIEAFTKAYDEVILE